MHDEEDKILDALERAARETIAHAITEVGEGKKVAAPIERIAETVLEGSPRDTAVLGLVVT